MMRTIKSIALIVASMISINAFATSPAPARGIGSNPMFLAMAILAGVLLMVIIILSGVLKTAVKTKIRDILNSRGLQSLIVFAFLISGTDAMAQEVKKESIYEATPLAGMHPLGFYLLFAVILLELFVILWMCLLILRIIVRKEAESAVAANEATEKKPGFFSNLFVRKFLGVKPASADADVMLDHEYDGIRELDNDLPPWWKYGFYLTIVSAIIYLISYHVTHTSMSSIEEYNAEMASAEASVNAYRQKMALNVDESNAVFVSETDKIEKGKLIYQKNCAVCHGPEGQGIVGPNFCDNNWIYGNKPGDLFKIVKNGTSKGMKPWKDDLTPVEIQNVIGYIHTLLGTKPANPKDPEGNNYDGEMQTNPEVSKAVSDSSKNIEIKS